MPIAKPTSVSRQSSPDAAARLEAVVNDAIERACTTPVFVNRVRFGDTAVATVARRCATAGWRVDVGSKWITLTPASPT